MRLTSILVNDWPPIRRFQVEDLSDVVVVAGPNGVGKTRLMARIMEYLSNPHGYPGHVATIEATSQEERAAWGVSTLNLGEPAEAQRYLATLHANRRRRNLRSSILQFESDRSIVHLQPYAFTWDITDPMEEELGWSFGFQGWKNRWQDTVHSMYRLIEHQKQSIANRAVQLRKDGKAEMKLEFDDPMTRFKEVFSQLLAPKMLVDPSARRQTLEYEHDGHVFDVSTLSSGEREVVNIAFDFLLRQPTDCIVFFDEPELHLHPELSHRLIRTLQGIGARNQFVLSTHSPDVITASLNKSVVFLSPPRADSTTQISANQAIPVTEDDETNQALRLLGQSIGIVALGKKLVLIEGEHSSLDKDVYGSIVRNRYPELVMVPSGGRHVIQSFEILTEAVLSKTIWGVEFFMLCDRDSAPPPSTRATTTARLRILSRYHLENFFLDEYTWAHAFRDLESPGHWLRDPALIRARFRQLARDIASYATALAVTARLRQESGNIDVMPKACHGRTPDAIISLLIEKAASEWRRIADILEEGRIRSIATEYHNKLIGSIDRDDDDWKDLVPGKTLLAQFASAAGVQGGRMKNLYLSAARDQDPGPFSEIDTIFAAFSAM